MPQYLYVVAVQALDVPLQKRGIGFQSHFLTAVDELAAYRQGFDALVLDPGVGRVNDYVVEIPA